MYVFSVREQIAIEAHRPEKDDEIELRIGDIIRVQSNHWNGYSKGYNVRTAITGLYPSYKVKEHWRIVDIQSDSTIG